MLQAAETASVQRLQAAIVDKDAELRDAQGLIEQLLEGRVPPAFPAREPEVRCLARANQLRGVSRSLAAPSGGVGVGNVLCVR